jgi:hypothetical protein
MNVLKLTMGIVLVCASFLYSLLMSLGLPDPMASFLFACGLAAFVIGLWLTVMGASERRGKRN